MWITASELNLWEISYGSGSDVSTHILNQHFQVALYIQLQQSERAFQGWGSIIPPWCPSWVSACQSMPTGSVNWSYPGRGSNIYTKSGNLGELWPTPPVTPPTEWTHMQQENIPSYSIVVNVACGLFLIWELLKRTWVRERRILFSAGFLGKSCP